jgi:hypothetical protein
MTYTELYNIIETLGYSQCAVVWNGDSVPDVLIRYFKVTENDTTTYNGEAEIITSRWNFTVYDRSGSQFESIFDSLKNLIENKNGFGTFFNDGDSYDSSTSHYYRSADIYLN